MAYSDTVTDALTCQATAKGVKNGTENLNSIAYLFQGIGAVAGGLMAFMVQEANLVDPVQCFGIYLLLQGFFFVAALQMSNDLEPGEISEVEAGAQEAYNEEGPAG